MDNPLRYAHVPGSDRHDRPSPLSTYPQPTIRPEIQTRGVFGNRSFFFPKAIRDVRIRLQLSLEREIGETAVLPGLHHARSGSSAGNRPGDGGRRLDLRQGVAAPPMAPGREKWRGRMRSCSGRSPMARFHDNRAIEGYSTLTHFPKIAFADTQPLIRPRLLPI
jgi:hypothetical protein